MDTKNKTFAIEDGPSASRLFDAVKYAYEENDKIKVGFSVPKSYLGGSQKSPTAYTKLKMGDVKLTGIIHESGNGHSYILHGYCIVCEDGENREVPFRAYYDTRARKGSITLLA